MATSWENRAAPTPFRQQLSFYLAADFIRAISSVGQSNRLITGRSWVRVQLGEPHSSNPNSSQGSDFFLFYHGKAAFGVVVRL